MSEQLKNAFEHLESAFESNDDEQINKAVDRFQRSLRQKTSSNDMQIGGNHYINKTIQPWDFIAANNLGYFEGNIVKYISRWRDKNGIDDLLKARHYLDKLIEIENGKNS